MEGFPEELILSPAAPGGETPGPGDLQRFLPQGFGLGAPAVILPWGGPGGSFYGFDQTAQRPILDSPRTTSSGGTIYFDGRDLSSKLDVSLDLMGVRSGTDYVAFASSSKDPRQDRYLDQLRLVSKGALDAFYGNQKKELPAQRLAYPQAIVKFIDAQRLKWTNNKLAGTAGGDGDWADERLGFGFHVENTYWSVYRVWSRPWLVTK